MDNERWSHLLVKEEGWGGCQRRETSGWDRNDLELTLVILAFFLSPLSFHFYLAFWPLLLSFPHSYFHIPSFFLLWVVVSGCQRQLLGPEPHRLPCRSHTLPLASSLTSSCLTCAGCLSGPHPNLFPLISFPRIAPSRHKYSVIQRCLITRETSRVGFCFPMFNPAFVVYFFMLCVLSDFIFR